MECHDFVIILGRIELELTLLEQVIRQLTNMLGSRICGVQKIKWPDQRVPETVSNTPGVTTFTHHNPLYAEIQCGLTNAFGDLLHVFVVADKNSKVCSF